MKALLLALVLLSSPSAGIPAVGFPAKRSAPPSVKIISQVKTRSKVVALTFDAGADRGYAPLILRTLERDRIKATFGMTGRWAQANLDLVRRMARDGDQFINHTYDHRSFTGFSTRTAPLTGQERRWEIQRTEQIIRATTRRSPKPYFRPPYGDYDSATLSLLGQLGYRYMIMWTVDSLGWEGLPAGAIIQRSLGLTGPGTILLMHVGAQSQDGPALQTVIRSLQRRGFKFVTVAQLLRAH